MSITLCITVRNESNTIENCLNSAIPWVDEILIADTGSTDHTVNLIRERYKLSVFQIPLQEKRCLTLCDARNYLIEKAKSKWILTLDADEILSVKRANQLKQLLLSSECAGYFGNWVNNPSSEGEFLDYKLFLFRNSIRMRGLVHSSATPDIRQRGLRAEWQDSFEVLHCDAQGHNRSKQVLRRNRLICALRKQPTWIRYHWFLGYSYFQEGNIALAEKYLSVAYRSKVGLFPVETICSGVVLASICFSQGKLDTVNSILNNLLCILEENRYDFEMSANNRIIDWILKSAQMFKGEKVLISDLPRFAY